MNSSEKDRATSVQIVPTSAQSRSSFQLCRDLLEFSAPGPRCTGRRPDGILLSTASSETAENVLLSSRAEKTGPVPVYSTDDQKKSHTGTSSGNGKSPNYSKESKNFQTTSCNRL